MATEDTSPIAFCEALYKVPWLFPKTPDDGVLFYSFLLCFSLVVILYVLLRIRRQKKLLENGNIRVMKQWLLPVYYLFLWFVVGIYALKAIDITIVYLAYQGKLQTGMPYPVAFIHGISFWTSEFWLFDALFLFLASNSHGIATIRRAFWISTILWIINGIVLMFGIRVATLDGFLYFVAVFIEQAFITIIIMLFMCIRSYPHHKHMWIATVAFSFECACRGMSDYLRYKGYQAFCFMDIADYTSSLLMPWLIIYTLRRDSKHWSNLSVWMQAANRGSIYNTFSLHVMGHERQSMTVWSELLSQHTKILKSEMLTPIIDHRRLIGGSGAVTKARYRGQIVAVKEWRFEHFTKHVIALWCKEALISSNFRHRNVVKLIGICIEPPSIKIVMEWCRHGSLRKMLISRRALPWSLRFQFLLDVAEGMSHLHRNGLVHRDLKTLNLLVDEDRHGHYVIRICDFGSSRSVDLDEYYDKAEQSTLSFASTAFTTDTMTTAATTVTGLGIPRGYNYKYDTKNQKNQKYNKNNTNEYHRTNHRNNNRNRNQNQNYDHSNSYNNSNSYHRNQNQNQNKNRQNKNNYRNQNTGNVYTHGQIPHQQHQHQNQHQHQHQHPNQQQISQRQQNQQSQSQSPSQSKSNRNNNNLPNKSPKPGEYLNNSKNQNHYNNTNNNINDINNRQGQYVKHPSHNIKSPNNHGNNTNINRNIDQTSPLFPHNSTSPQSTKSEKGMLGKIKLKMFDKNKNDDNHSQSSQSYSKSNKNNGQTPNSQSRSRNKQNRNQYNNNNNNKLRNNNDDYGNDPGLNMIFTPNAQHTPGTQNSPYSQYGQYAQQQQLLQQQQQQQQQQDMSLTSQILQQVASQMSTIVGSVQFLAPEILQNIEFKAGSRSAKSKQNSIYGFSADVYSYGCVMWEIITRREIYKGRSYQDIQRSVLSNQRPHVMESELQGCPNANFLLRLMDQCWQHEPTMRPNFNHIINMLEDKKDDFIPPPEIRG